MALSLPFPLLLIEIGIFLLCSSKFGFGTTLLWYWLPTFLLMPLAAFFGRTSFFALQMRVLRGEPPGKEMLNLALRSVGFGFVVLPFVSSRLLGVLLLFPPTRFMILVAAQSWLSKKMSQLANQTTFRTFSFGPGGFQTGGGFPQNEGPHEERDAQVIDVTPLEIEHKDDPKR